jgi:hypothetical protein
MKIEDKKKIQDSVERFNVWFTKFGDISYDRMDFWASGMGKFGKKMFYKNKLLGAPFAIWGLLLENFLPSIQKLYAKPHREVIGDAHFALSYLRLYELKKNGKFLTKATSLLETIKSTATPGYSGLCWGYTFGWQTYKGLWNPGIPLITITPYAFWAFKEHYEITGIEKSKQIALSIAKFTLNDLNEIEMPNGMTCSSYSPVSKDIVINANTYRAAVLMEAYEMNGDEKYRAVAQRNIDFVLSYQGEKGEWYYEAKPPKNNFIDNFHTCFVLRNLYQCYLVTKDERILESVKKGYKYYIENLFFKDGRPKHFSIAKYAKLRKYEMYDYAEGIKLGVLLKKDIPEAFLKSKELAIDLVENFQTKQGFFLTRVTSFGTKHKIPYLRWPQAQLFYSLTNLLKEIED